MRSRAKVVNFGIMYGMGARSLAQQMGIPLAQAQQFIGDYFRAFSGVRRFLDQIIADARRQGWVATLLGRRRYLPGLESAHGGERSATERAAINTPIQGSAADLMKLAMIRVAHALKARMPSARLLLQVHDELLLECHGERCRRGFGSREDRDGGLLPAAGASGRDGGTRHDLVRCPLIRRRGARRRATGCS